MTKERSSSVRRPVDTSLSNSFSSGASSLSSTNYGVKTIRVFKNGDPYHQGAKFVVNRRYIRDLDHLLSVISEKFDLPYGAKRLYTTNGKPIRHLSEIEDKQNFVASSSHFTPHNYGSWTNNPNGQSVQGSFPINPPQSRTSRSQTRNDTAKSPAPKKRSQSGLTIASEKGTKSRASTKSSKAPAPMKVDVSEPKKKKKVLKKKKKPADAALPEAETKKDEKKEESPKEKVEKEEVKEKKSEEAGKETPNQKEEEVPKKEEIAVPEEKPDSPRSHQRTPSPDEHQHSDDEHEDKGERQHTNKTATPTASEHSATDGEGHSDDEEHSDGNEPDEERSPPPSPRKPTPAPNGKLEKHSSTDNDSAATASDKDTEEKPPAISKGEPKPRKEMLSVFWDVRGVVFWELCPSGSTVNSDVYCNQPQKLSHAVRMKTKNPTEEKKKKEKKKKAKKPSAATTNWGDLSSFTKNIETLLKK